MQFQDILYEKDAGVAIATFNRPDALNAFHQAMVGEFLRILDDVQTDSTIRVLILMGKGRAFSAGIDLEEMSHLYSDPIPVKQARDFLWVLQDVTRRMVQHPKIIISAINGVAVGLGVELALSSDIRIAAESATFAFPEVKRGLFETNGVMYFLPRLVGLGRAVEMMLTGDKISALDALTTGLVTHLVPPDQLLEQAMTLARRIAANAPISTRLVKQVARRAYDLDLEAILHMEVDGMLECLGSSDLKEGTRAFVEKRPPVYTGE